jgi:hypothetical protein
MNASENSKTLKPPFRQEFSDDSILSAFLVELRSVEDGATPANYNVESTRPS